MENNPFIPDFIEKKIKHQNPSNMHIERKQNRNLSQKMADTFSSFFGSWKFIFIYIVFTILWCGFNVLNLISHWDPYPFQAYTFAVSVLAILMSGLILLSGNRQAEIDRAHAENAYKHVDEVNEKQDKQLTILEEQNNTMIQQHEELLKKFSAIVKESL